MCAAHLHEHQHVQFCAALLRALCCRRTVMCCVDGCCCCRPCQACCGKCCACCRPKPKTLPVDKSADGFIPPRTAKDIHSSTLTKVLKAFLVSFALIGMGLSIWGMVEVGDTHTHTHTGAQETVLMSRLGDCDHTTLKSVYPRRDRSDAACVYVCVSVCVYVCVLG